jgi:hypothetical protein
MTNEVPSKPKEWPSIDDHKPSEEGGPTARSGLAYQDEIVVGIFLEMIEDPSIQKVHCETHDDIVVKRLVVDVDTVEYIQVKSNEPNKLWSVADMCADGNDSLCAKSLARDGCKETSRFRIVTLRAVTSELSVLTYPVYGSGRETSCEAFAKLSAAVKGKLPNLVSQKGNGIDYWLEHCLWEVRHDEDSIRRTSLLKIMRLAAKQGIVLLPEQAETIEDGLRSLAYDAGRAFWIPDKAKKIISRTEMMSWWNARLISVSDGASFVSGGKLREKMDDAQLSEDQIRMALELRRDYALLVRTPHYMSENDVPALQRRVKSELASLRAAQIADQLGANGATFHSICIQKMDGINQSLSNKTEDQSAFLKGCMYDIADRCLHRFARHGR